MSKQLATSGIHHITAFAGDAQRNVDFYAGILGLRLVKKTVNFDAPDVYHLYFGNGLGSPGTAMTFFPFPNAAKGRAGGGQVGVTTFVIPVGAMAFWQERLQRFAVATELTERFGEDYLRFEDYDGLKLELVERDEGPASTWSFGGVPKDKAIKGFGGALLYSIEPDKTADTLQRVMGLQTASTEGDLIRFQTTSDLGNLIDLKRSPMERGIPGAGTVHHIAWRTIDAQEQEKWRSTVADAGFHVTPVADRQYFLSIYFRESGGILFEIATDAPGFDRDESPDSLGERLMLPPWLEPRRENITRGLPPIAARVLEEDLS